MNTSANLIATLILMMLLWSAPSRAADGSVKVALFVGRGASEPAKKAFKREFRADENIEFHCVFGDDVRNGVLKDYDAFVVPGGSANKDALSLGAEAREEVKRFVAAGGIYMGVCAGAYLSSQVNEKYLGLIPLKTADPSHWYRTDGTPVEVELTALGQEIFGTKQDRIRVKYENGPIFAAPEGKPNDDLTPLGFFRSEVVADGGRRGVMLGAPAAILARYGKGLVLVLSPHPEETPGLHFMEPHALRWLYAQQHSTRK